MSAMVTAEPPPLELLHAILRERHGDLVARVSDVQMEPIASGGYSGNPLYRVRVSRAGGSPAAASRPATFVLKRWLPGGHGERLLGVDRPLEALAWARGILQPGSLPAGVVVPFLGVRLDPSGDAAWILMKDVSASLDAYSRERPLPPAEAVERIKLALDGLARLHAWWEHPARQASLRRYSGLVPLERFAWCQAASYAAVLGRRAPVGVAPGGPVTDELRANVRAFLDWLPAGDRPVFEAILYRRGRLAGALGALPRTLIHGDADDRNVGLRLPAGARPAAGTATPLAELVLIDWEWIGVGPAALDVARLCGSAAALCDRSEPVPDAIFSDELPDHYFACYRAHGGALLDRADWRRSFDLALLAGGLTQIPFAGSMIRHGMAPVMAAFERQLERLIPTAKALAVA